MASSPRIMRRFDSWKPRSCQGRCSFPSLVAAVCVLASCYSLVTAFANLTSQRQSALRSSRLTTQLRARADGLDLSPGDVVTVIGASGNVGKLTTLRLTDESFKVRAVVRGPEAKKRLQSFLGPERSNQIEFFEADTHRSPEGLDAALAGAAATIVCTGTTAFPTQAWAGGGVGPDDVRGAVWNAWSGNGFDVRKGLDELTASGLNTPDAVDDRGVKAVVAAAARSVDDRGGKAGSSFKRFLLMSSIGVTRRTGPPFSILNGAGVLDAKASGESAVQEGSKQQGYSWTIVRPGQLFGGPYDNNYYLGTLFQLDKDASIRAVDVQRGDEKAGDTLRSSLAEVLVQTLLSPSTHNVDFTAINGEGKEPDADAIQKQFADALA